MQGTYEQIKVKNDMNKIKAIITACLMIGLAGLTFTPAAFGADEGISVNMTPNATATIYVNETTWEVSGMNATETLPVNISNTGDVAVKITTDANTTTEEGAWNAAADQFENIAEASLYTYAAHNTYVIAIDNETNGYNNIAGLEYTISDNLPASGQAGNWTNELYALNMPPTTGTNVSQHFNINITATAN